MSAVQLLVPCDSGGLTSPCSRRAAARRAPRRERPGPRPAAEGQLVRPPLLLLAMSLVACTVADESALVTHESVALAQAPAVSQSRAIYATVLSDFAKHRNMHSVALQAFTEPVGTNALVYRANQEHALVQSLLGESAGVSLDQTNWPPDLNVAFVSRAEVTALANTDWSEFIRRYPESQGLTRLSSIGFESTRQRAMVVISIGYETHVSSSVAYVLEASGEQWQVANTYWLVGTIG
jgi:hypothetical protein